MVAQYAMAERVALAEGDGLAAQPAHGQGEAADAAEQVQMTQGHGWRTDERPGRLIWGRLWVAMDRRRLSR
jgi:hypothetical protein